MKKSFLLLSIFLLPLFIQSLNAQVQVGVQAGINLTDLNMTQEGFKTATRTRAILGGILTYNFPILFSLQFEPAYVQKGADLNFSVIESGLTVNAEASASANYVDIPVLLKASLLNGPVKPYLIAGGSIAFLLGDAKLKINKATINGQDVTNMIPADEREQTLELKSTDYLLCLGGGIAIPVGQLSVFAEGRYDLGLTDVNNDPNDDTKIKTRGIQIKAGLLISL